MWIDEEGMHWVGKGARPSHEELTKEYQRRVTKRPLCKRMVEKYGKDKAEEMLADFRVETC